jgi:hypothetical protein
VPSAPEQAPVAGLLDLQRTAGNAAVSRLASVGPGPDSKIDPPGHLRLQFAELLRASSQVSDALGMLAKGYQAGVGSAEFAEVVSLAQLLLGLPVTGYLDQATAAAVSGVPVARSPFDLTPAVPGPTPAPAASVPAAAVPTKPAGPTGLELAAESIKWTEEDGKFQAVAYDDNGKEAGGHMTIGFGFDLDQSDADKYLTRAGMAGRREALRTGKDKVTAAESMALLKAEMADSVSGAERIPNFKLMPATVQAHLIEICYHRGQNWFDKAEQAALKAALGKQDFTAAATAMFDTNYTKAIYGRRFVYAVAYLEAFGKGQTSGLKTAHAYMDDLDDRSLCDWRPVAKTQFADYPLTVRAMKHFMVNHEDIKAQYKKGKSASFTSLELD